MDLQAAKKLHSVLLSSAPLALVDMVRLMTIRFSEVKKYDELLPIVAGMIFMRRNRPLYEQLFEGIFAAIETMTSKEQNEYSVIWEVLL